MLRNQPFIWVIPCVTLFPPAWAGWGWVAGWGPRIPGQGPDTEHTGQSASALRPQISSGVLTSLWLTLCDTGICEYGNNYGFKEEHIFQSTSFIIANNLALSLALRIAYTNQTFTIILVKRNEI